MIGEIDKKVYWLKDRISHLINIAIYTSFLLNKGSVVHVFIPRLRKYRP